MHLWICLHRSGPDTPIPYTSLFCPDENYYRTETILSGRLWNSHILFSLAAPSWKGKRWFGRSSSTKKKDLCPRKCCTGWDSQCCQLKVSLNLPCTFGFCLFQLFTVTNSCFSLMLNMFVFKLKWQCQEASLSIENTTSNPSALIMKLSPHF